MEMNPNQRTVTLKIPRGLVCKILIGLTAITQARPESTMQYQAIHALIKSQLEAHDQKWRCKK